MIDAFAPAVEAFRTTLDNSHSLVEAWQAAAQAAGEGAESTAGMVAKFGRAKFLGERALGHMDAGAKSIALMFSAMRDYWVAEKHDQS